MSKNTVYHYKVTDPEILGKLAAFDKKLEAYKDRCQAWVIANGGTWAMFRNSIRTGLEFSSVEFGDVTPDETIWKRYSKNKNDSAYELWLPRSTAKPLKSEFDALVKDTVHYQEMLELLVEGPSENSVRSFWWWVDIGFKPYKECAPAFYFNCYQEPSKVTDKAIEITTTEFKSATE